jgi:hypothetical protein
MCVSLEQKRLSSRGARRSQTEKETRYQKMRRLMGTCNPPRTTSVRVHIEGKSLLGITVAQPANGTGAT